MTKLRAIALLLSSLLAACPVWASKTEPSMPFAALSGFEANHGQWPQHVHYGSRRHQHTSFVTDKGLLIGYRTSEGSVRSFEIEFVGASPTVLKPESALQTQVNYLRGDHRNTSVPLYESVQRLAVYDGIDIRFHHNSGLLGYDFIVSPGASTDVIRLKVDEHIQMSLTDSGDLRLADGAEVVTHRAPVVYQESLTGRDYVTGRYRLENNEVSFEVDAYDEGRTLIIDPVVDYTTYLGGAALDSGLAVAADGNGYTYVLGSSKSIDFPSSQALQPTLGNVEDTFVAKLTPDGQSIVFATFIGGGQAANAFNNDDNARSIALGNDGSIFIAGSTSSSTGFPLVNAAQSSYGGGQSDGFVARLTNDGTSLLFSTYVGGRKQDRAVTLTLGDNDDVYVAGSTRSDDLPVTGNAYQGDIAIGENDAFIARYSSAGDPIYTTYFGGNRVDRINAIKLDAAAHIYVAGETRSKTSFPGMEDADLQGEDRDAFVSKLSADGESLVFSHLLAGSKREAATDLILADGDTSIVVGWTDSNQDFPVTRDAHQGEYGGGDHDGFVTWISRSGQGRLYSSYFGGNRNDEALAATLARSHQPASIVIDFENFGSTDHSNRFGRDLATLYAGINFGYSNEDKREEWGSWAIMDAANETSGADGSDNWLKARSSEVEKGVKVTRRRGFTFDEVTLYTDLSRNRFIPAVEVTYRTLDGTVSSPQLISLEDVSWKSITAQDLGIEGVASRSLWFNAPGVTNPNRGVFGLDDFVYTPLPGSLWVTGLTRSSDFPSVDALQGHGGARDAFITELQLADMSPLFSTHLGGAKNDAGHDIALSGSSSIHLTGRTRSNNDFPLVNALQSVFAGVQDAFITRLALANQPPVITSVPITEGFVGEQYVYQVIATDPNPTDILTYALTQAPAGMVIDASGIITFTPTATGSEVVRVEVDDGNGGTVTQTYILVVTSADSEPPVITLASPDDGLLTNNGILTVAGAIDEAGAVTVNGIAVTLDASFAFNSTVTLTEGTNNITIVATDSAGNTSSETRTVTLDTTAPVISLTAPEDNLQTADAQQTVSGNVNETATVSVNGVPVTLGAALAFSTVITLAEGPNTITVQATDDAGNVASLVRQASLDTAAPVITLTTPEDGLTTNDASLSVSGSLSESATVLVNGITAVVDAALGFSATVSLIEGANTLTVSATDATGNTSVSSRTVTLDTVIPVITINTPADGTLTNTAQLLLEGGISESATLLVNGNAVPLDAGLAFSTTLTLIEGNNTITLSATDAAGNTMTAQRSVTLDTTPPLAEVTAPVDGLLTNQATLIVTGSSNETGSVSINGTPAPLDASLTFTSSVSLVEGANTVTVVITDEAGNASTVQRNVTLDTIAPVLTVDSPTVDLLTNNNTLIVTGSINETGVVTVNGAPATLDAGLQFSATLALSEGANVVTILAQDEAGNQTQATRTVTLDTIAPVINVTAPADGATTATSPISVAGDLSETAALEVNGTGVTVAVDQTFATDVSLTEGANSLSLIATDDAGNIASVDINVTLDTTPPEITVGTPLDGSVLNTAAILVGGAINEPGTVTVNGNAAIVDGDNNFQQGPIILSEGPNIITVEATDEVGNVASVQLSVLLDTEPPQLNVTSPLDQSLVNTPQVQVIGTLEAGATLTLNGINISIAPDETFDTTFPLDEGANVLTFEATDPAGNTTTALRNVTLDSTPPSLDSALINRGNPAAGVLMIDGQPGATEPGVMLLLENPSTGFLAATLSLSDGSFTTDIAALANETVTIVATDSAGNQSATVSVQPVSAPSLSLLPIGDQVMDAGTTNQFTVIANDSSASGITLAVAPAPLPDHASFDVVTGVFRFAPDISQAGDYVFTFSATTGAERVEETITVTVPAAPGTTSFAGRLLDANSLADDIVLPISGATVSFDGTGLSTLSDANGDFQIVGLPAGDLIIDIDTSTANPGPGGSAYAAFREVLPIQDGVTNRIERPFSLPRLSTEGVTVVPGQSTFVSNSAVGVTLTAAPDSVFLNGQPFTGEISISEVPEGLAPAALPPTIEETPILLTTQPVGLEFTTPATVTFPNTEGMDPGLEVEILSMNPEEGRFEVVGIGRVSADGSTIETISGGLTRAAWWLFTTNLETIIIEINEKLECNCEREPVGSEVTRDNGNLIMEIDLPEWRALERSHGEKLVYQSARANPTPSIMYSSGARARQRNPSNLAVSLSAGGVGFGPAAPAEIGDTFDGVDRFTNRRGFTFGASFGASGFASGSHAVEARLHSSFVSRGSFVVIIRHNLLVVNEENSNYGSGWNIDGVFRLTASGDDLRDRLLLSPSGHSSLFERVDNADDFITPDFVHSQLVDNLDGTFTLTEKDGTTHRFNDSLLQTTTDRNGNDTRFFYNVNGQVSSKVQDPNNLTTTFTYDINGKLASITDPANRTTLFENDARGDLVKVTYPDGKFETFTYNNHLLADHRDERGKLTQHLYDSRNRLREVILPDGERRFVESSISRLIGNGDDIPARIAKETGPVGTITNARGHSQFALVDRNGIMTETIDEEGRSTTHVRDDDSNPTQTTRPNGAVVNRTFDDDGNVLTITEAFNGATTTFTYDDNAQITSVTNPRNHTTTIVRDPAGNPTSIINELGHTTTMDYNGQGLIERMQTPNGLVTTYTYNNDGLLETKTETPPLGSPGNVRVTSNTYNAAGLLDTVTTPDGIMLTFTYDGRSRLEEVTDNAGQSITFTYDDAGNIITTETRNGDGTLALVVNSIFDDRNRLTQTRSPHDATDDSIVQMLLDAEGNLEALTDPKNQTSSNVYDKVHRVVSNTHRLNGVTTFEYDDLDRITQVLAPNGAVTNYTYDLIGRRLTESSPDRGTLTFGYDLANNLTSITDARGIITSLSYDELERVTAKTFPNTIAGKVEDVSYVYDICPRGVGRLCERTDESGVTAFSYDAFGNVITETRVTAGATFTHSYTYDEGDNIVQQTLPSGRDITITRDAVRRMASISADVNGASTTLLSAMTYRGDNQLLTATFGNGAVDMRQYDLQGRLTQQSLNAGVTLDTRSYTFDKNSNIESILGSSENNVYGYDALDRITSDTINTAPAIDYTYDQNDNRLTRGAGETVIEVNSNRILRRDDVVPDGSTISFSDRQMIYNDAGRLYQLIEDGTLKAEYVYNDNGLRTQKTVHDGSGGSTTTVYHYDQFGQLVSETTEAGAPLRDYLWHDNGEAKVQIDAVGSDQVVYLHSDHLLTTRLATNQSGQVTWRWEGEAFGNTLADEIGGVEVNLRFPGQYFDSETNLHYNHFRYYDPAIGRYVTSDPIGLDSEFNTYSYVLANPILGFDTNGLETARCAATDFNCAAGLPPDPPATKEQQDCIAICLLGIPFQAFVAAEAIRGVGEFAEEEIGDKKTAGVVAGVAGRAGAIAAKISGPAQLVFDPNFCARECGVEDAKVEEIKQVYSHSCPLR